MFREVSMLMLFALLALPLQAAEAKLTPAQQAEQKEESDATAEEAAEIANQGEQVKLVFEGKLELNALEEGKDMPAVIGSFTSEGKTYGLKLKRPELYEQLKKLDGKQVILLGRPRNSDKYFVASGLQLPAAPPHYTRPRGSL